MSAVIEINRNKMHNNDLLRRRIPLTRELEKGGPTRLDLETIKFFLETEESCDGCRGWQFYGMLATNGILRQCLGLREADVIIMHSDLVPKHWDDRGKIYLWKSACVHKGSNERTLWVPYLKRRPGGKWGTDWDIDMMPVPPIEVPFDEQPTFPNLALMPSGVCGFPPGYLGCDVTRHEPEK
jgi:hypothetical protein